MAPKFKAGKKKFSKKPSKGDKKDKKGGVASGGKGADEGPNEDEGTNWTAPTAHLMNLDEDDDLDFGFGGAGKGAKKAAAADTAAKGSKKGGKAAAPLALDEDDDGMDEDEDFDLEEVDNNDDGDDNDGNDSEGDLTDIESDDEDDDKADDDMPMSAKRGNVPGFGGHGDDALGLDDDRAAIMAAKKRSKSGGFQSMGLSYSVLKGVLKQGYQVPTPIQRKCIPLVLENKDVVGMARTGSGKTAAFVVPMLEKLKAHSAKVGVRAIILSPSRELAFQTLKVVKELGRYTDLRFAGLVGGDSMEDHFATMTNNPDVVVATPGRLMHLCVEMELSLSTVEYIVFDEADRLFEMGFEVQLHEILHRVPSSRQTLLFSATLPKMLVDFAKAGLSDPVLIRLDADTKVSSDLELGFLSTNSQAKLSLLIYLLTEIIQTERQLTIVFVATKHHVEYIHQILTKMGIYAATVYGSMDAEARKLNVTKFRSGQRRVLIVTDVASRGIDIPLLDNVINYDFPPRPKLFVHRVGRAGRAGRLGKAYSFVTPDEMPFLIDLQLFLGRDLVLGNTATTETDEAKTSIVLGTVPPSLLENAQDELKAIHAGSVDISNLSTVTTNAYKMYYKTRPVASPQSYTRAKEFSSRDISVHPWFVEKMDENEDARLQFFKAIRSFKPSDTIFEVGKHAKEGLQLMQKTRKLHESRVVSRDFVPELLPASPAVPDGKAQKKLASASEAQLQSSFKAIYASNSSQSKYDPDAKSGTYKDEENYISYQPKSLHADMGYALNNSKGSNNFLEAARDAVLDFTGEDVDSMRKGKAALKWDAKKRNFVRPTVGADNVKRIRTESGALINASYKTNRFAEWKEKNKIPLSQTGTVEQAQLIRRKDGRWVPKRTNADLYSARNEPEDDNDGDDGAAGERSGGRGKFGDKGGRFGDKGGRFGDKGGKFGGKMSSGKAGKKPGAFTKDGRKIKSELKSSDQIRKERMVKKRRDDHVKRRQNEKARRKRSGGSKK